MCIYISTHPFYVQFDIAQVVRSSEIYLFCSDHRMITFYKPNKTEKNSPGSNLPYF